MLGNTFAEIIILIYNSIIVWQYLDSWRQTTPYQRQPSFNSTKSHYNRIKDSQTVLMQIWNADCTARASHVKSELQLNKEALSGDQIDLPQDSWFISSHNSLQIDADPACLGSCSVGWPGPSVHATSAAVISSQQGRAAVQKVQLSMLCCQLTGKNKNLHRKSFK